MIAWRLYHRAETGSTNQDAREGAPGEAFTADFQTAGRGRLDHRWLSPAGSNLLLSAVLSVEGVDPAEAATLPLVVGLSVVRALAALEPSLASGLRLKWPNDVHLNGRKICGILCERKDDRVIAGIGVNVRRQDFPPEIASRAIALEEVLGREVSVATVRDVVLAALGETYETWRAGGLAVLMDELQAADALRGHWLAVRQTDGDTEPVRGICGGIRPDGALDVGGVAVYAGEAHIEEMK